MLNIKVIDCVDYVYIESADRYTYIPPHYLFDGKEPERTNKDGWYKLNQIPSRIQKKRPARRENERFELKKGYIPTELMPEIITMEMYSSEEYDNIISLYERKYDEVEGGYEDVEFSVNTIYTRKDFEFIIPKKYPAKVSLITEIEDPEELYQERPCTIESKDLLNIIRNHVRKNIDNNFAKITSDYDFHFEVVKKIPLSNPYSYMTDVNWANKRKKPKWVERCVSDKQVVIINFKDKSSSSDYGKDCVVCPSITGENYEDLCRRIDEYLDSLMKMINKKYCECPTCQGWGIVEENES